MIFSWGKVDGERKEARRQGDKWKKLGENQKRCEGKGGKKLGEFRRK